MAKEDDMSDASSWEARAPAALFIAARPPRALAGTGFGPVRERVQEMDTLLYSYFLGGGMDNGQEGWTVSIAACMFSISAYKIPGSRLRVCQANSTSTRLMDRVDLQGGGLSRIGVAFSRSPPELSGGTVNKGPAVPSALIATSSGTPGSSGP